jgi:hypothetical protein
MSHHCHAPNRNAESLFTFPSRVCSTNFPQRHSGLIIPSETLRGIGSIHAISYRVSAISSDSESLSAEGGWLMADGHQNTSEVFCHIWQKTT